jgi:hypothetical protein
MQRKELNLLRTCKMSNIIKEKPKLTMTILPLQPPDITAKGN